MVVVSIARLPLPIFLSLLLVAVLSEISIIDYSMALSQRSSLIVRRGFCGRGFLSSCITSSNHGLSVGEKRRWPSSNLIPRSSLQQRSYSASSSLFANNVDAPSSSSQKRYTSSNTSSSSHKPQKEGEEESENWSNYERLVRKLYMTNLFNPVKLGLENMDRLHKILGSPMDQVSD